MDSSTVIFWTSLFLILGVSGLFVNVASNLGLHYLPIPFHGFPGENGLKKKVGKNMCFVYFL